MPIRGYCGLFIFSMLFPALAAAQPMPEEPVQGPVSPKDSLKYFEIHPDAKIELVACEPQIIDPVSMAFDEFGRLWVAEYRDYPNGPAEGEDPKSRIKILRDKDGDGFYESAAIFADKLLFCNGVLPYRGGVIVTMAGQIAYLKDTDGDDKADHTEVWFRGFAQENPQLRVNHPTFGLDGWVYVSNGLRGGKVVPVKEEWKTDAPPLDISRSDFRFHPETGKYEALTGAGQFGLTFDDYGNRFTCSNRNPCMHVVLEQRDVARNPLARISQLRQDVSPAGEASRVFSITNAWTTSTLHAGQFTAACGVTIYRGDGLPKEFYGNSFTCEPTGSLVHRDVLIPKGATFDSHYGRDGVEFLASRDSWFRPVNLAHGPDGAMYLCDMYRAVIEHPQYMPDELKHRPDLTYGNDRGRIYRLSARKPTQPGKAHPPRLDNLSSEQLADLVTHSNVWHRETASRLILERNDEKAAALLNQRLIDNPKLDETVEYDEIATYWVVNLIEQRNHPGKVDFQRLIKLIANGSTALQGQVLLADAEMKASQYAGIFLLKMGTGTSSGNRYNTDIPDALRFPLILQASRARGESAPVDVILACADEMPDDIWLERALLIAARSDRDTIIYDFSNQTSLWAKTNQLRFLTQLAEQAAASGNSHFEATMRLFERWNVAWHVPNFRSPILATQMALFEGLGNGLRRRGKSLQAFIAESNDNVKTAAKRVFDHATEVALAVEAKTDERATCLDLLRYAPAKQSNAALRKLALEEPNLDLRRRAIDLWASRNTPDVADALLTGFSAQTPALRSTILTALVQNRGLTAALVDAMERGRVAAAELTPVQQRILRAHNDPELKPRIAKLLASTAAADRKAVLEKYQPALTLDADPGRGRAVFQKNCITCHRIGKLGVNVAPDIADSRTKRPDALLVSILDPNRAIDNNYFSYTVVRDDGKVFTGIIAADTGSSITLRQPEDKTVTLLRDEIEQMKSDGVSLMPVGLEKNITVQDMADLISFIKNWRYLDGTVPIDVGKSNGK